MKAVPLECDIDIYTDCRSAIESIERPGPLSERGRFRTAARPVIVSIRGIMAAKGGAVTLTHVPSHTGGSDPWSRGNRAADEAANEARRSAEDGEAPYFLWNEERYVFWEGVSTHITGDIRKVMKRSITQRHYASWEGVQRSGQALRTSGRAAVASQCDQVFRSRDPRRWWFWLSLMCRWLPTASRRDWAAHRSGRVAPCRLCALGAADTTDHVYSCPYSRQDMSRLCHDLHALHTSYAGEVVRGWRSDSTDYPDNAAVLSLLGSGGYSHSSRAVRRMAEMFVRAWRGPRCPAHRDFAEALSKAQEAHWRQQVGAHACPECHQSTDGLARALDLSTIWGDTAWGRALQPRGADLEGGWLTRLPEDVPFGGVLLERGAEGWTEKAVHAVRGRWCLASAETEDELREVLDAACSAAVHADNTRVVVLCPVAAADNIGLRRSLGLGGIWLRRVAPPELGGLGACARAGTPRTLVVVETARARRAGPWGVAEGGGDIERRAREKGPPLCAVPPSHAALHWFDPRADCGWPVRVPPGTGALTLGPDGDVAGSARALTRVANAGGIGGLAGCVPGAVLDVIFPDPGEVSDADAKAYWRRRAEFTRHAQRVTLDAALDIWSRRRAALGALDRL